MYPSDQLEDAGDAIYNKQVFFQDDFGNGKSIKEMQQQNKEVASRQISDSSDVLYLMYALITCQAWWQVLTFF